MIELGFYLQGLELLSESNLENNFFFQKKKIHAETHTQLT